MKYKFATMNDRIFVCYSQQQYLFATVNVNLVCVVICDQSLNTCNEQVFTKGFATWTSPSLNHEWHSMIRRVGVECENQVGLW